ncbi:FAD-binding and (Fe-S)-binding domain-containing protein [Telmatobacter sp. DSM 110680]|uniref:FAD-binding and (Fe-S)-binding domain-containing protein n=1 Tax=Telmatobacter sp. DSM 110680 TaxID=3036704 RepID=A0AAU7DK60_9BACT
MDVFTILNQPRLDHESFSKHRELEARLKTRLRGDVLFDAGSRALYATDASNYRQLPIGVILPRDEADVEAALAECRAVGAAVLPRGGGTSLSGQGANVAVIFDFSRYMNGLSSINPDAKIAVVQPGIVLDRLRDAAEKHHLTYAPDPATHSRCTLGGMIGNNSCGVHGLLGGKTVDNVESLDVVLYDGTRMTVGRTREEQLQSIIRAGGRKGEIYAGLMRIRDRYSDLVRAKFPRIPRRVSGYNLDELLPENGFNVARALVGSEGTCATVLSATLNLTASPPYRVLTVLGFDDPFVAADSVPLALEHKPIGLEGFDHLLVQFMRRKGLALKELDQLPPGVGFLLVEMGAWTAEEAQAKAEALARACQSWRNPPVAHICTPAEAASVWYVRESALGAVVFVPGEPDRWEGWEDAAVPPEKLGDYLRAISKLMAEYGYSTPLYGHYGQGCVHMRINFDFRSEEGLRNFREFLDRATDVVLDFGGSLSGEHGDGQARAALLPKMFGPELMQAFREFKTLWDPDNRMNPGKLIDAVRVYDPIENLRKGHLRRGQLPSAVPRQKKGADESATAGFKPHFAFARDGGSLETATERCVGVGACRKTDSGVMCPSYRATGDEKHSTRGRAHLLWEMLAGSLHSEGFQSEAVHEALDLCLSCKACKTECPVQVDMAAYKAEFLAQHYKGRMHPLRHYVFGFADKLARMGSITPGMTNAILTGGLTGPLIKRIAGVAPQRALPRLAQQSFVSGHYFSRAERPADKDGASAPDGSSAQKQVFLWPDTWNNYYHPQTLVAAESVLNAAGFIVETEQRHICCGRPLYDFGFLDHARAYLKEVLNRMEARIEARTPIIFLEPSCASVFKDELLEFFPDDDRATRMSEQVWLLADWLAEHASDWVPSRLEGAHVLVHGHCHHKAVFGGPANEIALLRRAGANVEAIKAGCCGMAGPFGFEAEKFEVSKAIASDGLLPAVEAAGPMTVLLADGFSCREQIQQLGNKQALHFAELLARSCACGG